MMKKHTKFKYMVSIVSFDLVDPYAQAVTPTLLEARRTLKKWKAAWKVREWEIIRFTVVAKSK